MPQHVSETCMFFVDDSNIWIEAQKFAASGNSHMPKLTDSDRDPRLRIDVGKLINALRNNRDQGLSFLYGSRPPPNDSVWEAFQKFKFSTKIYDRANGKGKEVDNSMATDLSSQATELSIRAEYDEGVKQRKANTTFVVVTGDRDMLPPIKKVLDAGIRVELWAWESGISREYLKLQELDLEVKYLNWTFQQISFTNFLSTRKGRAHQVDPSQAIVLCEVGDLGGDVLESYISQQLFLWTFLFYITKSKTGRELFVEFPKIRNIEDIVLRARNQFKGILTVLSWPEYASRFTKDRPTMAEHSNMYVPLTNNDVAPFSETTNKAHDIVRLREQHAGPAEINMRHSETEISQESNNPNDQNAWQTVTRSSLGKEHHRALRQSQRCSRHVRCEKRGDCGYYHTDEERDLFQNNPNQNFRLWKTKKCNVDNCRRGKRCAFAHTQDEAWCLQCHVDGHYLSECRYRR